MFGTEVAIRVDKSWSCVEKMMSNMQRQVFLWKMSTGLWSWLFCIFFYSVVDVYHVLKKIIPCTGWEVQKLFLLLVMLHQNLPSCCLYCNLLWLQEDCMAGINCWEAEILSWKYW